MGEATFEVRPFPPGRQEIVDALEVGVRRHMVHALLELDVTRPRQLLREREARTGQRLSFTAFVLTSVGHVAVPGVLGIAARQKPPHRDEDHGGGVRGPHEVSSVTASTGTGSVRRCGR